MNTKKKVSKFILALFMIVGLLYSVESAVDAATTIDFLSVEANGTADETATSKITLKFSSDVNGLGAEDITLSNPAIRKGGLTSLGNGVYELVISGTWKEGEAVGVTITNGTPLLISRKPEFERLEPNFISGWGVPQADITVYDDNDATVCTTKVGVDYRWSCIPPTTLVVGMAASVIQVEKNREPSPAYDGVVAAPNPGPATTYSSETPWTTFSVDPGIVFSPATQTVTLHAKTAATAGVVENVDAAKKTTGNSVATKDTSSMSTLAFALLASAMVLVGGLKLRKND